MYVYKVMEGRPPATDIMIADLATCIDAYFIFALVWSVGATTNEDGRYASKQILSASFFYSNL